jgi:hypothetical protein
MTRPFRPRASTALLLLAFVAGCGAHFDGSVLRKHDVSYRIGPLDPGFRRVDIEGNDLAFYKAGTGSIAVHATCRDYEDVPSEVLLTHLLFGTTHRLYRQDEEITVDGRAARHAIVDAELDGVPVRLEIYVLRRARCVFDLSYVSGRAAPAHEAFGAFAQAFRVLSLP